MQVTFEFAATTRDAVGERRIERTVDDDATIGDAVHVVCDEFDDLGPLVLDGSGRVRPSVNVLVDGEPVSGTSHGSTLEENATVTILPAVAGGGPSGRAVAGWSGGASDGGWFGSGAADRPSLGVVA